MQTLTSDVWAIHIERIHAGRFVSDAGTENRAEYSISVGDQKTHE
ncbi:MAG: hypothetical protein NTX72_03165 [Candidatus Uhrbacteria bacterium]|nr:hypothetical protein [Candidatus Uhrbacteria bacterium]